MSVTKYQALADALSLPPLAPPFKEGWEASRSIPPPVARTVVHDEQSSSTLLKTAPLAPAFREGWQAERFTLYPLGRSLTREEPSSGTILKTPPLATFLEGWYSERFTLYPLSRTVTHEEPSSGTLLKLPPLATFREGWETHDVRPAAPSRSLAGDVPLLFRFVATPLSFPEGWYAERAVIPPRPLATPHGPPADTILAVPPLATFREGWEATGKAPLAPGPARPGESPLLFPVRFAVPGGWEVESLRLRAAPVRSMRQDAVILSLPPLAPPFPEGWTAQRAVIPPPSARALAQRPEDIWIQIVAPPATAIVYLLAPATVDTILVAPATVDTTLIAPASP